MYMHGKAKYAKIKVYKNSKNPSLTLQIDSYSIEFLLMIKTKTALVKDVQDHIQSKHPFDTPEITSSLIDDGLPKYLSWVHEVTK